MKHLVIGSRGSALAVWQANHVRDSLRRCHGGLEIELKIIRTQGDKDLQSPLHKMLDKGLFTKEIENALLAGSIDLAVHSLKDLPTELPDGLAVAAVPAREDPADALLTKDGCTLDDIPPGAKVMSGSLRRRAQLLHWRGDLEVIPVRGNVQTRLRKFDESDAHGIIFASAGLVRLGLAGRISHRLDPTEFLPACGQGALGIEIRAGDAGLAKLLEPLNDSLAGSATRAERSFLATLEGGCQIPVGAYAQITGPPQTLTIIGMAADLDGSTMFKRTVSGPLDGPASPESIGRLLAEALLADGCKEMLDRIGASSQVRTESKK